MFESTWSAYMCGDLGTIHGSWIAGTQTVLEKMGLTGEEKPGGWPACGVAASCLELRQTWDPKPVIWDPARSRVGPSGGLGWDQHAQNLSLIVKGLKHKKTLCSSKKSESPAEKKSFLWPKSTVTE